MHGVWPVAARWDALWAPLKGCPSAVVPLAGEPRGVAALWMGEQGTRTPSWRPAIELQRHVRVVQHRGKRARKRICAKSNLPLGRPIRARGAVRVRDVRCDNLLL